MKPVTDSDRKCGSADADLETNVRLLLNNSNRKGFQRIIAHAEAGTIRLSGPVGSFFLRQTAMVKAKRVSGVEQVVDDLEVDLEQNNSCQAAEQK